MGALTFIRAAKRIAGLKAGAEYPHLESMLERESQEPHFDYRVLARWLPPSMAFVAIVTAIAPIRNGTPLYLLGNLAFLALAGLAWVVCDRLDRTIPKSRAKLRQLSEQIWQRYNGISNLVGIDPCLSPPVAEVLDEAAMLYEKHRPKDRRSDEAYADARLKASRAMEEAMAKLLQIAEPESIPMQQLELEKGWARPLLDEMRALDQALDEHMRSTALTSDNGPLAGLREVRMELQRIDAAVDELKQQ